MMPRVLGSRSRYPCLDSAPVASSKRARARWQRSLKPAIGSRQVHTYAWSPSRPTQWNALRRCDRTMRFRLSGPELGAEMGVASWRCSADARPSAGRGMA